MKDCFKKAVAEKEETIRHRRYLHENAEVGFDLPKTTEYVFNALKGYGYRPKRLKKGGVIAEIMPKTGGREGFILLRADMDGLKMQEESGLGYACAKGQMHACGHDMHTASLLSAAKLLKKEALTYPVRLLFQPAEEILQGAKYALDRGVCDGVKAAFALHVSSGNPLPAGTVVFSSGKRLAPSADTFEVVVKGSSCHGATPHQGIDALPAVAAIMQALPQIVCKEIVIGEGLLSIGACRAGETANVLSDRVTLQGTCRAFSEETRAFIKSRIVQMSRGIASAYRARASVRFYGGCPCFLQDEALQTETLKRFKNQLGEEKIVTIQESCRMGASEDFAYISQEVSSVLVSVSAAMEGGGYPLHHPRLVFDEGALPTMTACYLAFATQTFSKGIDGIKKV